MMKKICMLLVLVSICLSLITGAAAEPVLPRYVVPLNDATNIRSETSRTGNNVVLQADTGDVLQVIGYSYDMESNLWWRVIHTASGRDGYVIAEVCREVSGEPEADGAQQPPADGGDSEAPAVPDGFENEFAAYPYYACAANLPDVLIMAKTEQALSRMMAGEAPAETQVRPSYLYSVSMDEIPDVMLLAGTEAAAEAANAWIVDAYISKVMFASWGETTTVEKDESASAEEKAIADSIAQMLETELANLDYSASLEDEWVSLEQMSIRNKSGYPIYDLSIIVNFMDAQDNIVDYSHSCYETLVAEDGYIRFNTSTYEEFERIVFEYSFYVGEDWSSGEVTGMVTPARQYSRVGGELLLNGEKIPEDPRVFADAWVSVESVEFKQENSYVKVKVRARNISQMELSELCLKVESVDERGDLGRSGYADYQGILNAGQAYSDEVMGDNGLTGVRIAEGYAVDARGTQYDFRFDPVYMAYFKPQEEQPAPTPEPAPAATSVPAAAPEIKVSEKPEDAAQADPAEWFASKDGMVEVSVVSIQEKTYPNYEVVLQFRLDGEKIEQKTYSYDLGKMLSTYMEEHPEKKNRKIKVGSEIEVTGFYAKADTIYKVDMEVSIGSDSQGSLTCSADLATIFPDDFVNYDVINLARCISDHIEILYNPSSAQISNTSIYSGSGDIAYYYYEVTAQNRMGGMTSSLVFVHYEKKDGDYISLDLSDIDIVVENGYGLPGTFELLDEMKSVTAHMVDVPAATVMKYVR